MSKTLSNILTVFKIARILAKIVFICCIIGAACCLLASFMLPMAEAVVSDEMFAEMGFDISFAYAGAIWGVVACVAEIIFAFLAERYFKSVLDEGTPFTFKSAKECFRLGVASLIISVSASIISGIVSSVILLLAEVESFQTDFSTSITISTGLFFMFISMLFKYGTEQQQILSEEAMKEEQSSEL